jgi:hypothetical protein
LDRRRQRNRDPAVTENAQGMLGSFLFGRLGIGTCAKTESQKLDDRTLAGSSATDEDIQLWIKFLIEAVEDSSLYSKRFNPHPMFPPKFGEWPPWRVGWEILPR